MKHLCLSAKLGALSLIVAAAWVALLHKATANDDTPGFGQGASYLTTMTESNGNFPTRSVITLHADHTMSAVDADSGGPTYYFTGEFGSWKPDGNGGAVGRTLDFDLYPHYLYPNGDVARLDYTISPQNDGRRIVGTYTVTIFPLQGNPFDGGGTNLGTFNFMDTLLAEGPEVLRAAGEALYAGTRIDLTRAQLLAPFRAPGKIICVGLNYADHSAESGFVVPDFPTIFARFASSLIGPVAAIVPPRASQQLDYEGELVTVIGKGGALEHVAGYTLFNDASVRDFQLRTPQWTVGKNFDGTGAVGPGFVTADALPPGCAGLRLTTRLNGQVVQDACIDEMIFGVAALVSLLSETMTLAPGDLIVTGTPSGVGMARQPPLLDVCEVEVPGIGLLCNPVIDEDAERLDPPEELAR